MRSGNTKYIGCSAREQGPLEWRLLNVTRHSKLPEL
jgi:hypothetical protein